MGVTVTDINDVALPGVRLITGQLAMDSSYPTGGEPIIPSLFGVTQLKFFKAENKSGYVFEYDYDNNKLKAYRSAAVTVAGTVSQPSFTGSAASMATVVESFSVQNIKGAAADVAGSMTTDQDTLQLNGEIIDTAHAVSAGAWAYSEDAEIDFPRNVAITLKNDSGGPIDMDEVVSFIATVTGTFRGAAQTDTITQSFTSGNKTIATAKFRWKYGVKPFSSITSVVLPNITSSQNGLKIGVGIGRLIGIPSNTKNGVIADFVKVLKGSANLVPTTYDDTNKTLDLGAIADNDDFDIWYLAPGLESYTPAGTVSQPTLTGTTVAQAALAEVTNAANLSTLTGIRFFAVGI